MRDNKLRLLLVSGPTGCSSGGLAIDVSNIANRLTAHGHEVAIATTDEAGNNSSYVAFNSMVATIRLPLCPPRAVAAAVSLAPGIGGVLRRWLPDVVHVFSLTFNYLHFAAALSAKRQGIPLVWTPMMHPSRGSTWHDRGALGTIMRKADRVLPRMAARADAVVAATIEEQAFFCSFGSRRVVLAPPGVDGEPADPDGGMSWRRRNGLGPNLPIVLSLTSRDEPRKGAELLASVARLLDHDLPEARIVFVGASSAPKLSGPNVIPVIGPSVSELRRIYSAANVVLVPSRYEAFSRVVIEAWEQETPVVVTEGVGLASSVRQGGGVVVPTGDVRGATDALVTLLEDRQRALLLGRHGRAEVDRLYRWDHVVEQLEATYLGVAGPSGVLTPTGHNGSRGGEPGSR